MTKPNLLDQATISYPLNWKGEPSALPLYTFTPDKPGATKRKRYKLVNFPSAGKMSRSYVDWRAEDDRRSVAYAMWLASRDGLQLPDDAQPSVYYETIIIDGREVKRTKSVTFGHQTKHYKYGGYVSYQLDRDQPMVTINIPHWDFIEQPVIEIIDSMELAA